MKALEVLGKTRKKVNDKGFTLVELIVVLVILAILAAILVPALLGYIDRARDSQIVLNGKSVLTAAQAELSSQYGKNKGNDLSADSNAALNRIVDTADIDAASYSFTIYVKGSKTTTATSNHADYTVSAISYTQDSKTIVFDGTSWDAKNTATGTAVGAYTKTAAGN